jgi:integrase
VTPTGVKSWLLRYRGRDGKEHFAGLGPLHTINLEEARERARRARQQLLDGIDPLEAKKADKAARALDAAKTITFEEAATKYYETHERSWSNRRHRQQFLNTMKDYVYPVIGKLSVAKVDTGLLLKVLEPMWRDDKAATGVRVRGRIEKVLDWAKVRGYRQGENPARWKGHLDNLLAAPAKVAKAAHHAALPYAELPAFVAQLAKREAISDRALLFTTLTAARTGETLGATWDEIDLAAKVWTIPAERMKADKEHRVPLSEPALEILAAVPREGAYVFPGGNASAPLAPIALRRALLRLRTDITVHGFRSTFSDWAHERTAHSNHTIELSLAHAVGSDVEKAYRRGDMFEKRRKLMEDWARFATTPAAIGDNVVAIKAQK